MKRSKKMIGILLLTTSLLCACGNSKNQKIAAEYMEKVNQLDNGQLPSVQEVKDLDAEYYNLTPKQKELVGLSSIVGNFDEGSNTLLGGYLGFKNPEISVDPDKVLDNLDLEFDEQGNY